MSPSPTRPLPVTEFARVVGAYYQALVKNGVHDELAADLVRDWHARYISTEGACRVTPELPDVKDVSKA